MNSEKLHKKESLQANQLHKLLVLIAFLMLDVLGYSQMRDSTLGEYSKEDTYEFLWNDVTLLDSAENALQKEYWIAQSWIEMKNYAKAYEHLSKVYAENPYDAQSTKLFYDVSQWLNRRSPVKQYSTPKTLLIEGAWSHEASKTHEAMNYSSSYYYDAGEYWEVRGSFSHDVGSVCRFKHTLEFQNSPYTSYFDVSSANEETDIEFGNNAESTKTMQRQFSLEVKDRHVGYGLESCFLLPKNFTISVFGRFILMNRTLPRYIIDTTATDLNVYEGGGDNFLKNESEKLFSGDVNKDFQSKYISSVEEITKPYYLVGLSLYKTYNQFAFSFRASYLRYWSYNVSQFGTSFLWMPMGNLDFYLKTKVAALLRNNNSNNSKDFIRKNSNKFENFPIIEEIIGVKTTRFLWLEASFLVGNQKGYEDSDANIVSLTNENTKYRASLSAYIVLSEMLRFNLTYRMTRRVSSAVNVSDNDFYEIQEDVSDHLLSMGVKWNF